MTKIEAYQELSAMDREMAFIANVFLTSGGPACAKTLKALVKIAQAGLRISCVPLTMPYELLVIDGLVMSPREIRKYADQL